MNDIRDFSDTAAIIFSLDLVIAADTSVAQSRGRARQAGVDAAVLEPLLARLTAGEESAWYPNVRLFRQTTPNKWDDVIERVTTALNDWRDRN